jgi:hypothetical protein
VQFAVTATKSDGLRVIPLRLTMMALFALMPDGKQTPLFPDLGKDKVWYRATLTKLLDLLGAGRIKPVVAERIPLAEAARAHELLERGKYAGKGVLVTSAIEQQALHRHFMNPGRHCIMAPCLCRFWPQNFLCHRRGLSLSAAPA